MSCYSYTSWSARFPKSVAPCAPKEYFDRGFLISEVDGDYLIDWDGETGYAESVVVDLIEYFGKPLDKVDGLCLDLHYGTDDDGHYECNLTIEDGKCQFEESEIRMVEKPMSECPISLDLGTPDYRHNMAAKAYDKLRALKWDHGKLAETFLFYVDDMRKSIYCSEGTDVADVLKAIAEYENGK